MELNERPEPTDPYRPNPADAKLPLNFDPEVEVWKDLGEAGTLPIPNKMLPRDPNKPDPDWICIRAVEHTQAQPFTADKLQFVVSFGRPVRARQKLASPFTHDGSKTGRTFTTFASELQGKNTSRGWWLPLRRIAIRPIQENLTHRYEFSVGPIVKSGAEEFHYGEDPEMDIEM